MKNNIKYIITSLVLMLSFFAFIDNVYAEVDCNKYACATCVYTSGKWTFTYNIKSDGNKIVINDKDGFGWNFDGDRRGIAGVNSHISNVHYFKNSQTNKIECYPIYKKQVSASYSGSTFGIYDNGSDGEKIEYNSSLSTNNNKTITSADSNSKTCKFTDSVTTKTNASCYVTINNNKVVDVNCGGFNYSSSDSDLEGVDFSKDCSDIQLYMYCHNVQYAYCRLDKDITLGDTTGGSDIATGDQTNTPDYTCTYKGQIDGKTLKVSKYSNKWVINLPGGDTKTFDDGKVANGYLLPSSDCEDIFYMEDEKIVKTVEANTTHTNNYIIQYCRSYDNVEQYCSNNACKISNPWCGSDNDSNSDAYGECPEELRPIIWFLKKLIFNTLQIFVPIILIVMGTIDLTKAMMASDEKGNKEAISKFIRRVLAAIFMFFIVTIVTVVIGMFAKTDVGAKDDWKACWHNLD